MAQAVSIVAKEFGVRLQALETGGTAPVKGYRYAVPKQALFDLLARYPNMRHQHVQCFIREAANLVGSCPLVPWHGKMFDEERALLSKKLIGNLFWIKSPAAKAYLWLLIQQGEAARNTKKAFSITDAALAEALEVSKTTAANYREQLQELGLVKAGVEKVGKIRQIGVERVKY